MYDSTTTATKRLDTTMFKTKNRMEKNHHAVPGYRIDLSVISPIMFTVHRSPVVATQPVIKAWKILSYPHRGTLSVTGAQTLSSPQSKASVQYTSEVLCTAL